MRNTEKFPQVARDQVRKAKPWQNEVWPGTPGATRKASIGTSVMKGRLGKTWALFRRKPVTQDVEKAEVLKDFLCHGLHQKVVQPHCPSPRRHRQALGEWRAMCCRRRLGSRISMEPEGTQVHGTWWKASAGPQGTGIWYDSATIHPIWEVVAAQWSSKWLDKGKHNRPLSPTLVPSKSWSRPSWKLCYGMWTKRIWLVIDNMASLRANCAWPI